MIVLDINSKFGAFTKSSSNTGGLITYPLPPKTTIIGMLGAILGYGFPETFEKLDGLRLGIKPTGSIKTKRMTYTAHYGSRVGRTLNVKQEILINPEYRIYIDLENIKNSKIVTADIRNILEENNINNRPKNLLNAFNVLLHHQISIFTLYMGRNSFPLKYQLNTDIKTTPFTPSDEKDAYIQTEGAIPRDSISEYRISEKKTTEILDRKIQTKEPTPFKLSIINRFPVAHSLGSEDTPAREIREYENIYLPSKEAKMEVLPKDISSYSYYLEKTADGEESLIICF